MRVLESVELEQKFQDKIDREIKIEPNDWMHEAYSKNIKQTDVATGTI